MRQKPDFSMKMRLIARSAVSKDQKSNAKLLF
jgi:hypothetical protein